MNARLLQLLADRSGRSRQELQEVTARYPAAIPPFLAQRVEQGTYSLAALRQFLPDVRELQDAIGFEADPTGEAGLHPERSILQTYGNRLAIILTQRCLVYCRFCFRKDFVGFAENGVSDSDLQRALEYVRANSQIRDVLVSGGDPLAVPNERLIPFLKQLAEVPHLKVIRVHSRALSAHPERIDDNLIAFLASQDKFWYYAHMNHPDDIDHPAVIAAVRRLLGARVPVMNQCVILAGVNDDPDTLARLMTLCYENKVMPYNLYLLDRVKGASHFEVPTERISEIARRLAKLSGPAQPALVFVDQHSKKHRMLPDSGVNVLDFLAQRDA